MGNLKNTLAGMLVVAGLAHPWVGMAETGITAVAGGVGYATPIGDNYQTFKQAIGFKTHVWMDSDGLLGDAFQFHGMIGTQKFTAKGTPTDVALGLQQWMFLAGVEAGRADASNDKWIRSFLSFDIGAAYTVLSSPAEFEKNNSVRFASSIRSGFEVPLWSNLSLEIAAPIDVAWGKNSFVTLTGEGLLRWAL